MELITNTLAITGKILDIIQYAKEELVIVSPYIQLDNWPQLMQFLNYKFNEEDKVKITFYIRQQEEYKPNKALEELIPFADKIKIFLIPDLHTKLYFNGKTALVTSMNLYQHSAENNFEIGTYFEDTDNLDKIKSYLSFLHGSENCVEYLSPERKEQEESKLGAENDANLVHETFTVVSIGSKWVKIINQDGYENKFLITVAPGLKEGAKYEADVQRQWHSTPYGVQVEYNDITNLQKIRGHCIICGGEIELNPDVPMCKPCYYKNKQHRGNIFGKFCHRCGNIENGITDVKPECRTCYNK